MPMSLAECPTMSCVRQSTTRATALICLYTCLYACLFSLNTCLYTYQYTCLYTCLCAMSTHVCTHMATHTAAHMAAHMPTHMSMRLYMACLRMSAHMSTHMSLHTPAQTLTKHSSASRRTGQGAPAPAKSARARILFFHKHLGACRRRKPTACNDLGVSPDYTSGTDPFRCRPWIHCKPSAFAVDMLREKEDLRSATTDRPRPSSPGPQVFEHVVLQACAKKQAYKHVSRNVHRHVWRHVFRHVCRPLAIVPLCTDSIRV